MNANRKTLSFTLGAIALAIGGLIMVGGLPSRPAYGIGMIVGCFLMFVDMRFGPWDIVIGRDD